MITWKVRSTNLRTACGRQESRGAPSQVAWLNTTLSWGHKEKHFGVPGATQASVQKANGPMKPQFREAKMVLTFSKCGYHLLSHGIRRGLGRRPPLPHPQSKTPEREARPHPPLSEIFLVLTRIGRAWS